MNTTVMTNLDNNAQEQKQETSKVASIFLEISMALSIFSVPAIIILALGLTWHG